MKANKVYLITGEKASGKTTTIKNLVCLLRQKGLEPGGFYSEGFWENGERSYYELVEVAGESRTLLCDRHVDDSWLKTRHYYFNPDAVRLGEHILLNKGIGHELLIIDEVGRLETRKLIWHDAIQTLLARKKMMIWGVRDELIEQVTGYFQPDHLKTFPIQKYTPKKICDFIVDEIQKSS